MNDSVLDALATLLQTVTMGVDAISISVISRDTVEPAATPVLPSGAHSLVVLLDLAMHNDVGVPAGPAGFSEQTKEWVKRYSELSILCPLVPSAAELREICRTVRTIESIVVVITELDRITDWMVTLGNPVIRLRFPY